MTLHVDKFDPTKQGKDGEHGEQSKNKYGEKDKAKEEEPADNLDGTVKNASKKRLRKK